MKNVWNSSDNGGNPPEGLDEKVRKGDLVRFTHFGVPRIPEYRYRWEVGSWVRLV